MLLAFLISLLFMLLSSPTAEANVLLTVQNSVMVGDIVKVTHAQLHFRWDNTTYDSDYLDNSEAATKLVDLLKAMGPESIDSVSVVAYASPEGVYEHNMMLSRKRAAEFSRALKPKLGNMGFPVNVRPGGESWALLVERVKADSTMSETARKRVLDQIADNSISVATRKWRFMHGSLGATREEGDVYHYILVNHYRFLRCLDIHIHYKEAEISPLAPLGRNDKEDIVSPVDTTVIPDSPSVAKDTTAVIPGIPAVIPSEVEESPRRPILGISTNIPYDITWIPQYGLTSVPSFSVEYYPVKGKYTFGADLEFSHWLHPDEHRYNQIHNLTLWGRRYFNRTEDRFKGAYLLANLNAAEYGIGMNAGKGWEGEGIGASVGGGWKVYIGKYFFLDMGGALGAFYSWYDPYVWGDDATGRYYYDYAGAPEDFVKRSKRLLWFGPTRVYFSVGIDFYGKRR